MSINIFVEICREGVQLPEYANESDACMDIRSAEDVIIGQAETKIIPTGLKMAIPVGYELQIRPRSGISENTPLRVANSPGTIDSGYRDEIGIIITNTCDEACCDKEDCEEFLASGCDKCKLCYGLTDKGNKNGKYEINKGDRIAQIILKPVPKMRFTEISDIKTIGNNRHGGFGSTGVT